MPLVSYHEGHEHVLDLTPDGKVITILPEHDQGHRGNAFTIQRTANLANGAVGNWVFKVPAMYPKQVHLLLSVQNSVEALYQFYEGATVSADGTVYTPINRNRNSSKVSNMQVYAAPTITGTGTLLLESRQGLAKAYGGSVRSEQEFVLKDNTIYLLRISNEAAGTNVLNGFVDWYETDYKDA